ncbi:enoyl-CoA hydratase-related protein, partial [Nocardia cyriacigeorgica]|uniref:enoyl-CoA hydratase-related protein n=1 Tax=Nocardia cyriacigeorgica TaxID=135487 RepID=UPI002454F42C
MDFEQIDYSVSDGGIATITLNRPERLNAYTYRMARELASACDSIATDEAVRVVVVTGSGRAFCAGADLDPEAAEFDKMSYDGEFFDDGLPRDAGGLVGLAFAKLNKPVIAAINGPAVGVGSTMTLPMDIRIASEKAKFGFVFARRCLPPETISTFVLPRLVGMSRAMEWIAPGRGVGGGEAVWGGVVYPGCGGGARFDTAVTIAGELAQE